MKLNKKLKTKKSWSKVLLYTLIFALGCLTTVQAQQITVSGIVTSSDDNMPIPGVAIVISGTAIGAVTDFDGLYNIQANLKDVLVFSYLGMTTKNVIVTGAKMNVTMDSDLEDLEEVVVIGYGAVKKKELTGAVSQVKAEAIEQFVTSDVASALQGQVAGVNVTAASGEPGEASNIQIRGVTSLSGTNTPLFVVNGIPQIGDPGLAPSEIETIDILKDAASTAVYGARGAAGVILITTKQGKSGQMSIDFNYTYGIQSLGSEATPLMNTPDQLFYEITRNNNTQISFPSLIERFPEWINNDNTFDDYVLNRNAEVKTYNLSVSGGTDKLTYNIVTSLFDQDGSIINSNFKRYNGRASTTYNTDNWKIDGSLAFTVENRRRSSTGLIVQAGRYSPFFPVIDPSNEISESSEVGGVRTPSIALNSLLRRLDDANRDRINASLSITRKLSESFNFVTRVGANVTNETRSIFRPNFILYDIENEEPIIDETRSGVTELSSRETKFNWDAILNFKKQLGDHSIAATGSVTLEEDNSKSFDASIQGVINNNITVLDIGNESLDDVNSGAGTNAPGAINDYTTHRVGLLGRVQYNYKEKYLLSGLVRRDASSRFGKDFRWGTFPSISAAWNISDEPFWQSLKSKVNRFKLRLSHGTIGYDGFPDYAFASTIASEGDYIFDPADSGETIGTSIISYSNEDIKWETSVSNNIGIDIAFLKNKLSLTADYYVTNKRDMIFPVTLPGSAGAYYDDILFLNIGDMQNKGLELAANYRGKIGKSRLRMGATFTTNDNEITKMQDGVTQTPNPNVTLVNEGPNATVSFIAEGYEAGAFFLYETNGVIQTAQQLAAYQALDGRANADFGDLIYVDTNNDGKINNDDRVYKGSGLPDFEYGLNLNWSLGNFDLSMNWYGTVGAEVLNGNKAAAFNFQRHLDLVNMWTPDNPISQTPIFRGDAGDHFNYSGLTDQWLENGDYLRLKQITLGYSLPKDVSEKIGLDRFRLSFSAQNALTFTKYSGYDPEVGGNNVARRGVDNSRYPLAAIYTLGVKIDF
ncbi:TonB-dependent receptor [Algibacter sp. AS12]|uniref:SusC/RagA family TonB-linked outer membrane protein n=1 Tax=Algibacter sp. AS12 TaxID=3135773 RepID=UPI00398B2C1C